MFFSTYFYLLVEDECGGLLFFCGGCDKVAHGKGLCYFLFLAITNITLISLITKWLQRTLYFFYE